MGNPLFKLHPEVEKALHSHTPVLALESTIIAHGMPFPENLSFAKHLLQEVRTAGATPAIVAIIRGKVHLGLQPDELELIARGVDVEKISRKDIGYALTFSKTGATTVSATMYLSHLRKIPVFATGGIGGVHQKATQTMDISQDIIALSQIPQVVVSSGAKAILDLSKTLEMLETYGIPVLGYGVTRFPAFYSRSSRLELRYTVKTPEEIATWFHHHQGAGLRSALLVANPVPKEMEVEEQRIETFIAQALEEAEEKSITGKDLTPFLLERIAVLSKGASLKANIALAIGNARLGARIVKAIHTQST